MNKNPVKPCFSHENQVQNDFCAIPTSRVMIPPFWKGHVTLENKNVCLSVHPSVSSTITRKQHMGYMKVIHRSKH